MALPLTIVGLVSILALYVSHCLTSEAEPVDQMHFQIAMFLFIDLMVLISPKAVFPQT